MKAERKAVDFVLDCSVTVAWFFEDETNAYAESVEDALITANVLVPVLWPLEVANALVTGERRKRTTEAKVLQFLSLLQSLPIIVDGETISRAWTNTLHLARTHHLSAYDAAYLELALRRGMPLATMDAKLKEAAAAAGVTAYVP